jgi:predicted nucleic acid-binding protein
MTAKLDASALIYLGKADLLTLAAEVCVGLVITTGVYEEAVVRGRAAGHRDADRIAKVIAYPGQAGRAGEKSLVQVVSLAETARQRLGQDEFPSGLGKGERETIMEAVAQGCLAVLDDVRARSAAMMLGATFCRTETLLMEALVRDLIGPTEFEAALLRLAQVKGIKPDDLAEWVRLGRLIGKAGRYDRAKT